MSNPLLDIQGLSVLVNNLGHKKYILDNVSLSVGEAQIVGIVGGSGSGKTTTGLSVLRLLDMALHVEGGEINFRGPNILRLSGAAMQKVRGKEIGMVFQEPLYAFNPVFTIGYQVEEVLKCHSTLNSQQRQQKVLATLEQVGIKEPLRVATSYPHQLSGGMRQRAMIAQAIVSGPSLLIADEPTSNLDVTLQAKIMEVFRQLRDKLKISILLISHDLGMVGNLADHIYVMTGGKVVEAADKQSIMQNPQHEYTRQLMAVFKQ